MYHYYVIMSRVCIQPDEMCDGSSIDSRRCRDEATRDTCCSLVEQDACTNPGLNPFMIENCALACCCNVLGQGKYTYFHTIMRYSSKCYTGRKATKKLDVINNCKRLQPLANFASGWLTSLGQICFLSGAPILSK